MNEEKEAEAKAAVEEENRKKKEQLEDDEFDAARQLKADADAEGLAIPEGCGTAVAVRKDGATVRDSIDIEGSAVVITVLQVTTRN